MDTDKHGLNFNHLVESIRQAHDELAAQAGRAVNVSLTLRNWLIGCYISEYELHGADRASYGDKLLSKLSLRLEKLKVSNCNRRQLYRYLRFFRFYPQIGGTLNPQFRKLLPSGVEPEKVGTAYPQLHPEADALLRKLAYSHIDLLVDIDDDTKRAFYEIECIRGNWSVRELKRQIHSLYYERSGLSKDKKKLSELAQQGAQQADVSWYRKNMMTDGDNPPVGILLCTDKNHALAEYALAGMDNHLFVSKYLLELPRKEEIQRFIEEQIREERK